MDGDSAATTCFDRIVILSLTGGYPKTVACESKVPPMRSKRDTRLSQSLVATEGNMVLHDYIKNVNPLSHYQTSVNDDRSGSM